MLVADEQRTHLEVLTRAVEDLGHEVITHEIEIEAVGRATAEHRPDFAIVALHEDTHHALELISEIVEEATCPVAVLAASGSTDFLAQAAERGIFAYLDSTDEVELQGGIEVALLRYREFHRLLDSFDRRARIERAKGILIERHSIGEHEAFERLRAEARTSRRRLIEVVDEFLATETA